MRHCCFVTNPIQVEALAKNYGSFPAVKVIDFEVEAGEVFGLLGPNGAGKTTTVEILEGLRSRSGGRVAVLTFHSGEDRRVKKTFATGLRDGLYADIAREVIRPSPAERHANPRSTPAKLRWARRAG